MNLILKRIPILVCYLSFFLSLTSCQKEIKEQSIQRSQPSNPTTVLNSASCSNETITFHRIDITYLADQEMLMFSSTDDVNAVLNILDSLYETSNAEYEEQYPNLTEDELDAMDEQTGFDEFQAFKDFESEFPCFLSRRSKLEELENEWLETDFESTDPDEEDFTFDDAENTIFNSEYKIMIGETRYEMREDGIYDIDNETGPMRVSQSYRITDDCKSNKRLKEPFETSTRKFHLKVAINSWYVRSGAKGKVVAYKLKNGKFKKARVKLAVYIGGNIYNSNCTEDFSFSERKPTTGYKKRRQLKKARHKVGEIWKTKQSELSVCFDNDGNYTGCLPLTW